MRVVACLMLALSVDAAQTLNSIDEAAQALVGAEMRFDKDSFRCYEPTEEFISAQKVLSDRLRAGERSAIYGHIELAIHANDPELVGQFLDHVSSVPDTATLAEYLRMAASYGTPGMLEVLVDRGAPIDASDGADTPLSLAAWFNLYDNAKWLLEHGADVNASADRTMQGAIRCENRAMLELLEKWGLVADDSVVSSLRALKERHGT